MRRIQPLCGSKAFEQVFANADAKQHSQDLFLLVKKNTVGVHRIGLITSKKKLRRAVDRNRFRRVARAAYAHFAQSNDPNTWDLIVMVKTPPKDLFSPELSHRLLGLIEKALKKSARKIADVSQ